MIDLKTPSGLILLIIILAAVPLTYVFAPPAVAVMTGMVSTLFGSLVMGPIASKPPAPQLPAPNEVDAGGAQ